MRSIANGGLTRERQRLDVLQHGGRRVRVGKTIMLSDKQLAILKQIKDSLAFDGADRGEADKLVIEGYVQKDGDLYQLTPIGEKALIDDRARVYELTSEAG